MEPTLDARALVLKKGDSAVLVPLTAALPKRSPPSSRRLPSYIHFKHLGKAFNGRL